MQPPQQGMAKPSVTFPFPSQPQYPPMAVDPQESILTLQPGYYAYGAGFETPKAHRMVDGFVKLAGIVRKQGGGLVVTVLPPHLRPRLHHTFVVAAGTTAGVSVIRVESTGNVRLNKDCGGWVSLDNLLFKSN